ncbi:TPA: hypothetical protein GRR81_25260 [Vibrio parahaemolyticus]|uniref:hypothetical protein n=4 Tax=Vibrio parahaemolyticus TaxID=670 RepID=UPI000422A335|nr:hypothetical protein [Vibrio parahaemolyticus]EGQ8047447.1 hypothetical protein [Vibrio parahaemolyticus]EGQ9824063.1 hypothetical protein [Vibrio parahaemolyticus]EHH2867618.1 hypothetical protein [Vibrio parahaemolyticus]EJL3951770.1 hypothetical protein [Vibrio parahaemolyticus]EJP3283071.1 hypothetical protein [Vibrio parahaemolyticus]
MLENVLIVFFLLYGLAGLIILGFLGYILYELYRRKKKTQELEIALKNKLDSNIEITNQDLNTFSQAYEIPEFKARLALYRTFKDCNDPVQYEKLKVLVKEVRQQEPFDSMPDEVKPSLVRISELISSSELESDKHVLSPITNVFGKYKELLEKQRKSHKRELVAYFFTILGTIFGLISLYFAFVAPTSGDIALELQQLLQSKELLTGQVGD